MAKKRYTIYAMKGRKRKSMGKVSGDSIGDLGAFAIRKSPLSEKGKSPIWAIDHIPTGMSATREAPTKKIAGKLVAALEEYDSGALLSDSLERIRKSFKSAKLYIEEVCEEATQMSYEAWRRAEGLT